MRTFKPAAASAWRRVAVTFVDFRRETNGAVALLVALLMPAVVGAIGLGAEVGYWYMLERKLQHIADVAAYSGAVRQMSGASASEVDATVQQIAQSSGLPTGATATIVVAPGDASNTVRVEVSHGVTSYFSALFKDTDTRITVIAAAGVGMPPPRGCVTVLSPDAPGALTVWGSAAVNLEGCDVVAHSSAADSVDLGSTLSITDGCVYTSGGVAGEHNLVTNVSARCVRPLSGAPTDPFADLEKPGASDCGATWNGLQVECHVDLVLDDTNVTDNTVYVITGSLGSASNKAIAAVGVSFVLDGTTEIKFAGNSQFNLLAPTSGPLAGVLFTGEQPEGTVNDLRGTVDWTFGGAIHLPNSEITFSGNSASTCTELVGKTITFTGNSEMNCSVAREEEAGGGVGTVSLLPL